MMANNLPTGSTGKMYKKPIKKNVGLRAFFPEMPSSMNNLEKAKIWVKRHNNNYFMGWTQEQLQSLDPIVRPLTIITPELYKRHMNRSEYCRIVKLKYCLESDADWAKDFRRRLGTDSSKGGFRSLGEAKLYATQLWRQYSELYDVHRARIGNNNSRVSLEKHHSLDGSRDPKTLHISSIGSAIISSAASLLSISGSPELHSFVSPYRRGEDDKILGLHLPSMDESNHNQLNEFPSSSSLNISPLIKVEREDKFESSSTTINTDAWPIDNNKVSSSHGTPVFPSVDQMELSILERVDVLLRRRRKDFFLGYTEDQLRNLSPYERPLTTVTEKEYQEYLFSDEGQLTSALSTVFDLTEPWAFRFKKMLHLSPEEGGFTSWSDVKQELYILLQNHLSGNSNSHESVTPALLEGSHGAMSVDSDLPSTSGLVDKITENIDFSNPATSSMILGRDLKETAIALYSPGIFNGRLSSQKKSPDSSERTIISQASPSAPETTEDAITIDDDTNSEDNFAPSNQSRAKSPSINGNKIACVDDIWEGSDHRRAAKRNNLQQQLMSDSGLSITSSIERSAHSLTSVSSSFSASPAVTSTPSRFTSPLGKVGARISSIDLASFGRNPVNTDQAECSPMDSRSTSRIASRFSSQMALAMNTSSNEVPSLKAGSRGSSSSKLSSSLYGSGGTSCKSLVSKLWSLRDKLAECCRDDPAISWHDKLRPHLKLIRSQLGETYTLPNSVHECMADLFLITLQLELLDKPVAALGEMS